MDAMRYSEPKNSELFYNLARLFARYSGRKQVIINKTMELLSVALVQQPENSFYLCEQAYQMSLLGDYSGAFSTYQKAS